MRSDVPQTATDSSLIREMRTIEFITRLIDEGKIADGASSACSFTRAMRKAPCRASAFASKLNADWAFLTQLKALGEARSARWINAHFQHLSQRSTADFSLCL